MINLETFWRRQRQSSWSKAGSHFGIVSQPAQAYKCVLNQLLKPYCTTLVASRLDR